VPFSLWQVYVSLIAGSTFCFATVPLSFEYAIMQAHPVSEGMVAAFLTGTFNFVMFIFLVLFYIPGIGHLWMNYVLVIVAFLPIPFFAITKRPHDFTNGS